MRGYYRPAMCALQTSLDADRWEPRSYPEKLVEPMRKWYTSAVRVRFSYPSARKWGPAHFLC